jgi:hypothetical protein
MKSFTYTARDTKGATQTCNIQADDRAGVVREVKARGMVPLSITENRGGKHAIAPSWYPSRSLKTLMMAIVSLIAIGMALFTLTLKDTTRLSNPKEKVKSKNVTSKTHANGHNEASPMSNSVDEKSTANTNKRSFIPIISSNNQDSTTSLDATNTSTNKVRPHFSSMAERNISMLINTPLGSMPPPILGKFPTNENLMAILERDIMVYDEDNEKMLQRKANVAVAKQMLKEFMAQGRTSSDFIDIFRKQLADAYKERKVHQDVITQLYRAGEYDAALKYAEEQNPALQAKNITPLHVPLSRYLQQPQQEGQ